MRQFIFSLLCLCRQDLFEVFFPGTVSRTLYPFQELVCFMIVYSFQNLFLFRNYILFRNCFCQTNPFQELFLSNQAFSGTVFVKQVLFRNGFLKKCPLTCLLNRKTNDPDKIRSFIPGFFRNCHVWHCLVPSPSHTILFQELSCLTLPFSKPIAYRPLSGTVISDTACFKAGQFLIQCKKMLLRKNGKQFLFIP